MATRIKEGVIPYKGGTGIEITNNHVINLLLREYNNLIHVDENNKVYVDLQLPDGIEPDDDFPVGVTTGKILEEDGWQQSGLILNWKTTSGDYNRLIYANDGNLYVDYGDGVWHLIGEGSSILSCNTRTFYLPSSTVSLVDPDLTVIQEAMNWYFSGKNAILWIDDEMFVFEDATGMSSPSDPYLSYISTSTNSVAWESSGLAYYGYDKLGIYFTPGTQTVSKVRRYNKETSNRAHGWSFIPANNDLRTPFMASYDSDPISKAYLDIELAKKQNILTAGTRISIRVDPVTGETIISADVSGAMVYKGNVTDASALPQSGNTIGDCWYAELEKKLYAWDGTQWNDVGGVIDLTNYFNKQTDTSDSIVQGNTNLFVTPQEKIDWNGKQDPIIAGNNITIDPDGKTINATVPVAGSNISIVNNQINNDAPFEPNNAGTMGQILQKKNDGTYEWVNVPGVSAYTGGHGINIDNNNEVSNTLPFEPDNAGTAGQVLKKTQNGYEWENESGGAYTAGPGINIDNNNEVSNTGVITVNNTQPDANGNINVSGTNYTGGTGINITSGDVIENSLPFDPDNTGSNGQVLKKTQNGYEWANESGGGTTYYAGTGISIDGNNYINNDGVLTVNGDSPDQNGNINVTEFDPDNTGTTGYVLVKTQNGYEWQDKGFNPGAGSIGQVLTKTQNGYEWANAADSGNVKLFTLNTSSAPSSLSLIEAQAAWDWYKAGKLPILRAYGTHQYTDTAGTTHNMTGRWDYYPEPTDTDVGMFTFTAHHDSFDGYAFYSNLGYTEQHDYTITFTISNDTTVTAVNSGVQTAEWTQFLSIGINYQTPYIPQYPGSPATKQYVDDRAVVSSTAPTNPKSGDLWYDTTNSVLKIYNGSTWVVAGGSSSGGIINDTTGTTTSIDKIWVGTQGEYNSLSNYYTTTLYIIKQS